MPITSAQIGQLRTPASWRSAFHPSAVRRHNRSPLTRSTLAGLISPPARDLSHALATCCSSTESSQATSPTLAPPARSNSPIISSNWRIETSSNILNQPHQESLRHRPRQAARPPTGPNPHRANPSRDRHVDASGARSRSPRGDQVVAIADRRSRIASRSRSSLPLALRARLRSAACAVSALSPDGSREEGDRTSTSAAAVNSARRPLEQRSGSQAAQRWPQGLRHSPAGQRPQEPSAAVHRRRDLSAPAPCPGPSACTPPRTPTTSPSSSVISDRSNPWSRALLLHALSSSAVSVTPIGSAAAPGRASSALRQGGGSSQRPP